MKLMGSYAVWKSMEFDWSNFHTSKKKAEYGKIFAFPDYCLNLVFCNKKIKDVNTTE